MHSEVFLKINQPIQKSAKPKINNIMFIIY